MSILVENETPIRLIGGTGSPYTQKMLALMRYRRIPYAVTFGMPDVVLDQLGIERPKMVFMPTFLFAENDGKTVAECDSTPIIRRLESMYEGRSALPSDPALAFIDYLLEDFGDEWMTKCMFHYRWHLEEDADNAGTLLPLGMTLNLSDENAAEFKKMFTERQVSRLSYVGSNDQTAPLIEASYRRFMMLLNRHLANQPFLLGGRPGAGDFGIYGQLTQLVGFDPSSRRVAHEVSPRGVAWVDLMNDQSGAEPKDSDWISLEDQPDTLKEILSELGRVYAPALLANAKAVQAGEKAWSTEIDGQLWEQRSFPYQAKCLQWINERYQSLSVPDRTRVNTLLAGTGCEQMLA